MSKLLKNGLCVFLCVLMIIAVIPAQAFAAEGDAKTDENGKPVSLENKDGKTDVNAEWEMAYPYGVFAFGEYGYAAEEGGDVLTVPIYRLGGTEGRATAFVTYTPVAQAIDENRMGYANTLSTDDVIIEVEDTSPIAMYQPLGKDPDPEPGDYHVNIEKIGANYKVSISEPADDYKWQSKGDYGWVDCYESAQEYFNIDQDTYDKFDFRCVYTLGDASYCTESLKGEKYVKPEPEVLPEKPDEINIGPADTYTKLDTFDDPYSGYFFAVTFAEGEWVKHIQFTPIDDELSECPEMASLVIDDCEGGCVNRSYNSSTVTITDNDPAEPFSLGFTEKEIKADKADGSVKVTVRREGGFQEAVSIDCETVDGTAMAGVDYLSYSENMAFFGNINELTFDIQLIDNGVKSDIPKTFKLRLKELKGDGDDLCTLTNTELTVSLVNSGGAKKTNLASKLAEPDAIDLAAEQELAPEQGVVDTAPDTVVGEQVEEEEPAYATIKRGETVQGMLKSYHYDDTLSFDTSEGNYWSDDYDALRSGKQFESCLGTNIFYPPETTNEDPNWHGPDYGTWHIESEGYNRAVMKIEHMAQLFSSLSYKSHGVALGLGSYEYKSVYYFLGVASENDDYTLKTNFKISDDYSGVFIMFNNEGYYFPEFDLTQYTTNIFVNRVDFKNRRIFTKPIGLTIHTANDGETGHGEATAPDGAFALTSDNFINDVKPKISIVEGAGGVNSSGQLYVGSRLKIDISDTAGYSAIDETDGKAAVYLTNSSGKNVVRAEKGSDGFYYMTMLWDKITEADLKENYTINIVMERDQELEIDISPNVPASGDDTSSSDDTSSDDTSSDAEDPYKTAYNEFWDRGEDYIEYGYSAATNVEPYFNKNKVITVRFGIDDLTLVTGKNSTLIVPQNGVNDNIQWVNFHRDPDDFIVINGKTYAGDETIWIGLSDFNSKKLHFFYYSADYASVPSKMIASIDRVELYRDANANGRIDGYVDENGFFRYDDTCDVKLCVMDEDDSFPEEYFNMVKYAGRDDYSQLFFKIFYTMNPRKLKASEEETENGRAQVLPAFNTSITDPANYFALTTEQKQYRYLISGQDKSGRYTSDDHLMYGGEATAEQYVDVPLGGDKSPAYTTTDDDGTLQTHWDPEYSGNLLYPYGSEVTPIWIDECAAGTNIPLATDYEKTGELSDKDIANLNGYLGSYVADTNVSICVFEQKKTVTQILAKRSSGKKGANTKAVDDEEDLHDPDSQTPSPVKATYSQSDPPDMPSLGATAVSSSVTSGLTLSYETRCPKFSFGLTTVTFATNFTDLIIGVNLPIKTYNSPLLDMADYKEAIASTSYGTKRYYARYADAWKCMYDSYKDGNGVIDSLKEGVYETDRSAAARRNSQNHWFCGFSITPSVSVAVELTYDPVNNKMDFHSCTFTLALNFTGSITWRPTPMVYVCVSLSLSVGFATGFYQDDDYSVRGLYSPINESQRVIKKDTCVTDLSLHHTKEVTFNNTAQGNRATKITFATNTANRPETYEWSGDGLENLNLSYGSSFTDSGITLTALGGSGIYNGNWSGSYISAGSFKFSCDSGIRFIEIEWSNSASTSSSDWTASGNKTTWVSTERKDYLDVEYNTLSVEFKGKLAFELYQDKECKQPVEGASTGFVESEQMKKMTINLKHCKDRKFDNNATYYLKVIAQDGDAEIGYIRQITNVEHVLLPEGAKAIFSPSLNFSLGMGGGLIKAEIYANFGITYTWASGHGDEGSKFDTVDWAFSCGINVQFLIISFSFEIVGISRHYDSENGWGKTKYSIVGVNHSGSKRGTKTDYDAVMRLPEDTSDTQTIYTPDSGGGSSGLLKSYTPTDKSVPFELSGYSTTSDAAKLLDGVISGYDYRVVIAKNADGKDVNYVIYHISSKDAESSLDKSMLVMSELVMTGNKKGLVNPVDPESKTPYIVVDVDDKGEADMTGDLDFSAEAIDGGSKIRVVWVSYIKPAEANANASMDTFENAAKNTVVKTSTFTSGESGFAAAAAIDEKGDENADLENGECVLIPDFSEDAIVYVRSNHISDTELTARTRLYEDYLRSRGYDVSAACDSADENERRDQEARKSYAISLSTTKQAVWTASGSSSDLCVKIGDSAVTSIHMGSGVTVDSTKIEKIGDAYYIAYTTAEDCYTDAEGNITEVEKDIANMLTIKRLYLRTCTLGKDKDGKDIAEWGMDGKAVLLRTLFDYDDNGASEFGGDADSAEYQEYQNAKQNQLHDGIYADGKIEDKDNPYFDNLQFLNAALGDSLSGTAEEFPLRKGASAEAEDFLLFDMCGSTYIIRQSDLEAMTGLAMDAEGSCTTGTIIPFFTPDMENVAEDNTAASSGRTDVTIGVDGDGNLAAVYTANVPDTNNTALCISRYDPNLGSWGDKTILAMNYLGVYEDNLKNYRSNEDARAAFYGVLEPEDKDEKIVQGGLNVFRFNNPQIALGKQADVDHNQHSTLLVLTQGTMKYLQENTDDYTKELYPYIAADDDYVMQNKGQFERSDTQPPGVGIYAIEYGSGTQAVGNIKYSLLEDDYSRGAAPCATISFENTGDVAIRGSEEQPITVSLITSEGGAALAQWQLTENVVPGQRVALSGSLTLTETLPVGTKLYLSVSEDKFYESQGGSPFSAVSKELVETEELPELSITQADFDFDIVHEDGDTLVDFEFDVENRGTVDAKSVYALFSYDTGEVDEDGNKIYAPLDISKEEITMEGAELMKRGMLNDRTAGELGIGTIEIDRGVHVSGKIKISSEHFNEKTNDAFAVRVEVFSDADYDLMQAGEREPQSGVHNEYNCSNNICMETVHHQTVFTVPAALAVPVGTEMHIPLECKYTMEDETPHILVTEFDHEDGEVHFDYCVFRYGEFGNGSGEGLIELKANKEGSGYIRVKDVSNNCFYDIPYRVTPQVEGINVKYTDHGIFRFYNADGSQYDKEGTNQMWRFPTDVSSWGSDNTAPYMNDLAMGAVERGSGETPEKEGGWFTFKTDAESIDFIFSGRIKVESDFHDFEPVIVSATGGDGDQEGEYATVFFGNNPKEIVHTVKVTVLDGDDDKTTPFKYASFGRIIEHYDPYEMPVPDNDVNAPEIFFRRSAPKTGSLAQTVNGKPNTAVIEAYVFDETGIASVTLNGSHVDILDRSEVKFWTVGLEFSKNGVYELTTIDDLGNMDKSQIHVDWFSDSGESGLSAVPTSDPKLMKRVDDGDDVELTEGVAFSDDDRAYISASGSTSSGSGTPELSMTEVTVTKKNGLISFPVEADEDGTYPAYSKGWYLVKAVEPDTGGRVWSVTAVEMMRLIKNQLYITADDQHKHPDDPDPELSYTAVGLIPGDELSGDLTRKEGEGEGTYAITQGTLTADDDYGIIYKGADLTISHDYGEPAWEWHGGLQRVAIIVKNDMVIDIHPDHYTVNGGDPVMYNSAVVNYELFGNNRTGDVKVHVHDGESSEATYNISFSDLNIINEDDFITVGGSGATVNLSLCNANDVTVSSGHIIAGSDHRNTTVVLSAEGNCDTYFTALSRYYYSGLVVVNNEDSNFSVSAHRIQYTNDFVTHIRGNDSAVNPYHVYHDYAAATFTCSTCGHAHTEIDLNCEHEDVSPDCLQPGGELYHASIDFRGETYTDSFFNELQPALGHDYGEPVWEWHDGLQRVDIEVEDGMVIDIHPDHYTVNGGDPIVADSADVDYVLSGGSNSTEATVNVHDGESEAAVYNISFKDLIISQTNDFLTVGGAGATANLSLCGQNYVNVSSGHIIAGSESGGAKVILSAEGDSFTIFDTHNIENYDSNVRVVSNEDYALYVSGLFVLANGSNLYLIRSSPENPTHYQTPLRHASATFTCSRCGDHTEDDYAPVSEEIPASCTDNAVTRWHAKVTLDDKEYIHDFDTEHEGTALGHDYGEPEWKWSFAREESDSDPDSTVMTYHAEATFICSGCKDVQIVEAEVAEKEVDGKTLHVATAVFNNVSYTDVLDSYFIAHSLSLNGSIGVNYYLNLTKQEIKDGATVDFAWTVAGKEKTHSVTLTEDDFTKNGYRASCPIAIAEMTYDITATLTIGEDKAETDTYSAKQYSDVILNNEGGFKEKYISAENDAGRNGTERYDQLITLVQTMLDYGSKAQIRFDRNTDNLANGGKDYFTGEVDIPNGSSDMSEYLSECGLEYVGTSVVYLSETTLRHYYRIIEPNLFTEDIQNAITFDGEAVTYSARDGMIYFDKKNIAAPELDVEYEICINGQKYHYAALDYSALSYSRDDKSYSESVTKQLAAAVYRYNQAANAYFNR